MTLINWEMSEQSLAIFSDTLVLNADDMRPRNFMTKIFVLPHLNGLITGIGLAPLISDFFISAKEHIVARDIVHLAEYAPERLRGIWSDYEAKLHPDATSTIYTFGFDKEAGRVRGFAYRSTSNFESEELGYGMALKPAPADASAFEGIADIQSFVEYCLHQQRIERERPRMERVGIGGELWLYTIAVDGGRPIFGQQLICPFDHFEDDWEALLAQLPANQGSILSQLVLARDA
ncbi:hypothetical protein [Asticcacaulis machinosus]|uniref:Uncharacterized protein n=1 Tax=Asticcacaulis machinosus TaxID=2984211 RepID=A0ABT5HFW4_9CAUL|nr:hypothetical protein [Asticcacaulis machinosus]MDC7675140.1 hypothetical protein [Asticcacaulis machinosus]